MKKTIKNLCLLTAILFGTAPLSIAHCQSSTNNSIKNRLASYFQNYTNSALYNNDPIRLNDVEVDTQNRIVTLRANAGFAEQPFTRETVIRIQRDITRLLPPPYNTYRLIVLANGTPIEELIPMAWSDTIAERRLWGTLQYRGNPWVSPQSLPYDITKGLQGHHLSVWASHGSYYDTNKGLWQWQRPKLYCTTEDIFTQSFVVPFLIPMLERAGAYVFTPRERDWQRHEVIVDGDMDSPEGIYTETNGTYEWQEAGIGFSRVQDVYFDNENPFTAGTSRRAEAQPRKRELSKILWQPHLPEDGRYAVYVSYTTLPTSVSDAEYTVYHRGIATKFRVNQQMGGGTWVYLGTFDFAAGSSPDNCVTLTNQSNYRGTITADAVRFGGGMGNIARGDSLHTALRSELPRFLECSRYYAQWAGMPYELYKNKEGVNDYAEDINTRSFMTNRLARGSVYLPGDSGLCVPIELSLAVHSDAGLRQDLSHIGTLGVYTSGINTPGDFTDSLLIQGLLPSLRSRLMSRDLCDVVMTQVVSDIRSTLGTWNRRQMYDRNYSETRVPQVPSMILETLSHQNFADLLRGHDPSFKMLLSRAIYKGILKYTATAHGLGQLVTQPLPVRDFSAMLNEQGDSVHLSWSPTPDMDDATAYPTGYIVHTSVGEQGYDNGQRVYTTHVTLPVRRGQLTRYQVQAFNEGGSSMPCEELCVYSPQRPRHRLLIVNGFSRLAGPQPIDNDSLRGFDLDLDPGVVYQHSASYCGRQQSFRKKGNNGRDAAELGYSGNELSGMLIAGNTFDFPTQHARDFLASDTTLSISSCAASIFNSQFTVHSSQLGNAEIFNSQFSIPNYDIIDLILGAQRQDGYSMNATQALSPTLCQTLSQYAQSGGSLLVSGAYINEEADSTFTAQTLHCTPAGNYALTDSTALLTGMNTQFTIYYEPNEERYSMRRLSILAPTADAFCSVASGTPAACLAVAHQGDKHRTLTYGFPLECIREAETRRAVMAASLTFLLQ